MNLLEVLERAKGYGGLAAGAVASEIPYGYASLLEAMGAVDKGYADRVQQQFMPTPNETVQGDLQAAAPYLEAIGKGYNNAMYNAEQFSEMMPFMPSIPREGFDVAAQAFPELLGLKFGGKAVAKGIDNLAQPNTMNPQAGMVKIADDLPMDEASRMARAREMGFTDKLYHQTSPDAQKAILDDGFDTTILGAREGETLLPDGVYTKTNADDIGLHKNATQMELMVSPGNKAEYIDRAGLESHLMYDPEYSKLKTSWGKRDAQYANEFDDAFNKGFKSDADFDESERVTREILDRWQAEQKETAAKLRDRATKFLQSEGYDSVRVRRDAGSLGRQADTTVIFDPSRIRSPNAKFDPSKKNSKNLLDSLYPAGIGMGLIGGGLLSQDEQYY